MDGWSVSVRVRTRVKSRNDMSSPSSSPRSDIWDELGVRYLTE